MFWGGFIFNMESNIYFPSEKSFENACSSFLRQIVEDPLNTPLRGIQDSMMVTYKNHKLISMIATRQTHLGAYGKLDMALFSQFENNDTGQRFWAVNIFELKNVYMTMQDVDQVLRYRTAFFEKGFNHVFCHLIGPPNPKVAEHTCAILKFRVMIYSYEMDFGGAKFIVREPILRTEENKNLDVFASVNCSSFCTRDYGIEPSTKALTE